MTLHVVPSHHSLIFPIFNILWSPPTIQNTLWNYFNLTSTEKAPSRKYIQILTDPFSVSAKPFIWVSLLFGNYLILLKAPPPSTTSLKESSVKNHFRNSFPHHTRKLCVNKSRGGICREGKFSTYHKLTRHITKSTKYKQLQSTTYYC